MNYYFVQNGIQIGPVSFEGLMNVDFTIPTTVWVKGEPDWVPIKSKQELIHHRLGAGYLATTSMKQMPGAASPYPNPGQYAPPLPATDQYVAAPAGLRLAGYLINFIIVIAMLIIFDSQTAFNFIFPLFLPATALITFPLFGATIGQRIVGLKVVHVNDGKDFKSPLLGALREFVKFILGLFILPLIWLLWDSKKQNVYDMIFNTMVVKRDGGKPLTP